MAESENKTDGTVSQPNKIVLEVDAFPFKGLKISEDWEKLEALEGRTVCSVCKKSRKYFCYSCYVAFPEIQDIVPTVQLPLRIDIIKHAREMDGKSTAVHAAVLAPQDVRIFTYPSIPNYGPEENVVLIYPNKDAVSVEEIYEHFFSQVNSEPRRKKKCTERDRSVIHRAVFVDSTWNQSRGILKDSRMKSLPKVVLKSRLSQFWRHQADSPRWYLATIEAIHQFLVELDAVQWKCDRGTGLSGHLTDRHRGDTASEDDVQGECGSERRPEEKQESASGTDVCEDDASGQTSFTQEEVLNEEEYYYKGQYDNLLFFFRFMYDKIHVLYDHDKLRSYKRRLE